MTNPAPAAAWNPDPGGFIRDLEAKPGALARLAASASVTAAIEAIPPSPAQVVFLGMGSSRYAAEVAALRLRAAGMHAVAEYASSPVLPLATSDSLVVAISASGKSRETLASLERYSGVSRTVAVTEERASPLAEVADQLIPLEAGPESGGVACRTFQHTGLVLRRLEARLLGQTFDFAALCERVAGASADLLGSQGRWLPIIDGLLDGPDGVHVIAPADHWSSAAQSALMFREGPRRAATASETGDWNHVDVYLTKTTDYRALLYPRSPYEDEALDWIRQRGSTLVAAGGSVPGAAYELRYEGDQDPHVRLYAETLIAELLAARWWLHATQAGGD